MAIPSSFVILDAVSGTVISASDACAIDVSALTDDQRDALENGTDTDRLRMSDAVGVSLSVSDPVREPFAGPIIRTRCLGPTNARGSRVIATHKRDSDTVWRAVAHWDYALSSEDNHLAAARALIDRWPFGDGSEPFTIVGRGHDADAYYWLAVDPWQVR